MIRVSDKRLAEYLDIWAEWMRSSDTRQQYPVSVCSSPSSKEFDSMVSDMEIRQAKAVNAAIDDLPSNERVAVHHVKLASVWRLREPIEIVYDRACLALSISLVTRGLPAD